MGLVTLLKPKEKIILSEHVSINSIRELLSNKCQTNVCGHSVVRGHNEQKNSLNRKYNLHKISFPCNIKWSTTAAAGLEPIYFYAYIVTDKGMPFP